MKINKFLTAMTAIGIAVTFMGCAGKDGAPGATGPQGPAGTNGTSGLTITNISVTPGSWSVGNANELYYNTTVSVPTTDVCMVYVSTDNSSFIAMPWSNVIASGDEFFYSYKTGYKVQLVYYAPSGPSITNTLYFNIADIPPAAMKQHPKTNWKDYSQVNAIIEAQNTFKN